MRVVVNGFHGIVLVIAQILVLPMAGAQERVSFDSLDRPVRLLGHWFAGPAVGASSGAAPAVVLLHGYGGPYRPGGQLSESHA